MQKLCFAVALLLIQLPLARAATDAYGLELIPAVSRYGETTDTAFSIGMSLEGATDFVGEAGTDETIRVTAHIYPDAADIGVTADIFIVAQTPGGLYMRNPDGVFVAWNGKLAALDAALESVTLASDHAVDLFTGSHTLAGTYKYFIGYLKAGSDSLVFTPKTSKLAAILYERALLWRVSDGVNEIIVGGTIHVLAKDDFPLPAIFLDAYAEADILVTEVAASEFANIAQYAFLFLNDDGIPLTNKLSDATYDRYIDFLLDAGIDPANYELIHVNWVANDLQNYELDRLGFVQGVDFYFQELAAADGIPNLGLETLASQIIVFKNLGADKSPDEVIADMLDYIDSGEMIVVLEADIEAWRTGDAAFFETSLALEKELFPEDYFLLLTNRNQAWIPQLEAFLDTPAVEFVLVGSAHVTGPDSILVMLSDLGYTVEPYRD